MLRYIIGLILGQEGDIYMYNKEKDVVLKELNTYVEKGLTEEEVAERQKG